MDIGDLRKFSSSNRPVSAPPKPSLYSSAGAESISRPTSIPPASSGRSPSGSNGSSGRGTMDGLSLDLMSFLNRSIHSVVKTRTGSVLSRGFIMKTDYHPSGRALEIDVNLHGAPNFRAPRVGSLNVYGVAQPRTQGLRAILSVLKARPGLSNPSRVIWFSTREEPVVYISGRPFVLRDASNPRETLALSDRAENLEAIEMRLKRDILAEAARFGGLILTHNEVASEQGEGPVVPTWTHCDETNVRTSRELYENMKQQGWNVDYHRVPISPDRPIEDNYLDAYLQVIKDADPLASSLVFSCGIGAVRTTFAMVSACIIRRKQLVARGFPDPFATKSPQGPISYPGGVSSATGRSTPPIKPTESKLAQVIEQASAQQDMSRALLRLTYLLQQCLRTKHTHGAIELLLTQPNLLDGLRKAYLGHYSVVLSVLGCLDKGIESKRLVDRVIEANDHVTHLREDILMNRLNYALTTLDDQDAQLYLSKARKALEKYVFVIAFASYVEESANFENPFASWLRARSEIWNQITYLRRTHGSPLNFFAPVHDLSSLSKSILPDEQLVPGTRNDVEISGGQILGDEYSNHVIKNRSGIILREETLLKSDQWLSESHDMENGVRGAINFRQVGSTKIYALGQPSLQAVDEVIARVTSANPFARKLIWITLREEPIVYINGNPYCLRRERFSLRNIKDYGGISAARLEALEERLKDDVLSELHAFDGHVMLHSETADGSVVPVWEEVRKEDVLVLKELMAARDDSSQLKYRRIPITAEKTPDYSDLMELVNVVIRNPRDTPIIVNDQLGGGRSTMTAVLLLLVRQWLDLHREAPSLAMLSRTYSHTSIDPKLDVLLTTKHRPSYQIINNFLRVIPRGRLVKQIVDDAIDECGEVLNLRDAIEKARCNAEEALDDRSKRMHAQKGLQFLRRYLELMVFQAYLQSLDPDSLEHETIESFVTNRPVIRTFEKELFAENTGVLQPLERHDIEDGVALPDEVTQVVANRSGSILSASTILKSDFFSNLQKMTLPERIDGAPNFRRLPLVLPFSKEEEPGPEEEGVGRRARMVCGSGMPTLQGLRNALERVDAGPSGSNHVFWTSLREEPVIYIAGRPHVLRIVDKPLENVEATGVTTVTVEAMEKSFKKDILRELRESENGRILLHDEVEERPGVFSIIPIWETVTEEDILTPREAFDIVVGEGYTVNYGRVAITDEQAPLPDAIHQLYERMKAGIRHPEAQDFIFNCQMGRGRTTTGMVAASLIATTSAMNKSDFKLDHQGGTSFFTLDENVGGGSEERLDEMDGYDETEAYQQGEYKTILQLVGVLSHGRLAKRLTDRAIDVMQDVQNLRKAVYDYKLKTEALEKGTAKEKKLRNVAVNYLYRYGTLIVFANYLVELREREHEQDQIDKTFPEWLVEHREIKTLLSRRTLD